MWLKIEQRISLIFFWLLFSHLSTISALAQIHEASISEDSLKTNQGLSWDGAKWPWSKVVEIKDSLVDVPLGRVVLDKHTEGGSVLNFSLFGGFQPYPDNRKVYISIWGSKVEGCFAELIYQVAPPTNSVNSEQIVPKLMQIGINQQIVELTPQDTNPKVWSANYTYRKNEIDYTATFFMSRQLFLIDATTAAVLSQAPDQNIKARVTFVDNTTQIFPIGKGTVERWNKVFSYNPNCAPPN